MGNAAVVENKVLQDENSQLTNNIVQLKEELSKVKDNLNHKIQLANEKITQQEHMLRDHKIKEESLKQEKEEYLKEKEKHCLKISELEGQLMMLRIQLNPDLSTSDSSGNNPKHIKELYIDLKTQIRQFVSSLEDRRALNEDMGIEMEKELSLLLFKNLKAKITVLMDSKYSEKAHNEKMIGELLMAESQNISQDILSELVELLLGSLFQHNKGEESVEYSRLRGTLMEQQQENSMLPLVNNAILLQAKMMTLERKMDLVWYDVNTKYNPFEQTPQNGTREIMIESVLFPCLMVTSNKAVFEPALVKTKSSKLK